MTHPLIEKVAQAIYEAHQGEPGDRGPWEQRASIDDLIYPPEAQAAIDTVLEAIRPTGSTGWDVDRRDWIDALRAELKEPGA